MAGLLLAGVAHAHGVEHQSIDEYRSASQRALHKCARLVPHPLVRGREQDRLYERCISGAKLDLAGRFDAAIASTMDAVGRAALQRYHAAFLNALAGIPPRSGEVLRGYEQRQAGLRCALSHAWSEFELSEQSPERLASRSPAR